MPLSQTSLRVTEAYRTRMVAIRQRAQAEARRTWKRIDPDRIDATFQSGLLALYVTTMQRQAAQLSAGYLGAYVASETGEKVPLPTAMALTAGDARAGGTDLLRTIRNTTIGVKAEIKDGIEPREALRRGGARLEQNVGLATDEAAREALRLAMVAEDRVEGWQRAVKGTCGACMGDVAVEVSVQLPSLPLGVHPNCQCVTQPVVTGVPNQVPLPTGAELFGRMSKAEQDEQFGPEKAEALRAGEVKLEDLVGHSPQKHGTDFITERSLDELTQNGLGKAYKADFDESEHPRDSHGRFTRTGDDLPKRPRNFGFNDNAANILRRLDELIAAGVDTVRFPIALPPNATQLARIYEELLAAGITPIFTLGGWQPPPDKREYARICGEVARKFPRATLSLWNEPNHPPPGMPAKRAAALVNAAARAIRAANPQAKIIGPSVAPTKGWEAYFRRLYRNIDEEMDVGLNLYPGPNHPMRQLRRWYEMAAKFGTVHVTELAMAAWWRGQVGSTELTQRGVELLRKLGAETVLLHSVNPQLGEWRGDDY